MCLPGLQGVIAFRGAIGVQQVRGEPGGQMEFMVCQFAQACAVLAEFNNLRAGGGSLDFIQAKVDLLNEFKRVVPAL